MQGHGSRLGRRSLSQYAGGLDIAALHLFACVNDACDGMGCLDTDKGNSLEGGAILTAGAVGGGHNDLPVGMCKYTIIAFASHEGSRSVLSREKLRGLEGCGVDGGRL